MGSYDVKYLIDLAVSLEKDGAEYYEKLSHLVKNKSTKEIFRNFAADERKHAQLFSELKNSDAISIDAKIEEDISKLIEQISQTGIMPGVAEENVEKLHPLTAIKLGIKAEKNTVKLYKQILRKVKTPQAQKTLEELIKEEKQHFDDLTEMHKNKTFDF